MFRFDIRQLKDLRRYPVPPEVIASGRVKLIAVIEASPMATRRPSAWFMAAAWRPVMAAMIVIVVATGGGTFAAAHDALPGERLYVVKLVGEEFRERMTLTSEQRFVVQAAHASRRLEETQRLIEIQGLGGEDRAARVRTAMDRYEGHLFTMNEIVVRLETDPEKPKKGKRAFKAAEGMFDRHAQLIESATRAESVVASFVIDPIEATFTLEDDVFFAMPSDDGDDHDGAERHRRERAAKIGDSLKRMRQDFEDRREEATDDGSRSEDSERDDAGDDAGRGDGAWVDADVRIDTSFEKPLEIKLGM